VNDDGTFGFAPDFTADVLPQSIVSNNGAWEEWGDTSVCTATAGCFVGTTPGCSTFQYRVTNQGGGLGPVQQVTSQVRLMPTRGSRSGPFRMQDMNGVRLLYSASGDRVCDTLHIDAGFGGFEIIVTELNN
jgi:hypothetical protein